MRSAFALILAVLVASTATAQRKPWELRPDIDIPFPVALPEIPPTNPFLSPVLTSPVLKGNELLPRFDATFPVRLSAYVDSAGEVRRVAFVALSLPIIADDLRAIVRDLEFTPGRSFGGSVPTWIDLAFELEGRIDEGEIVAVRSVPPDRGSPPRPDPPPAPSVRPEDLALPATAVERLEEVPSVRRFRARVGGREWRQDFRIMAEVDPRGRCRRVVFLSVPEGLRGWLAASMAGWTFQPAMDESGPTTAWVTVEGSAVVEVSTLRSEALRVIRASSYPGAAGGDGVGRLPGE